jgi:hypothetical protein
MPGYNDPQKVKNVVDSLSSTDQEIRLQAVREVKNAIIGSKSKKACYSSAGAVEKLVSILSMQPCDSSLIVHAVISRKRPRLLKVHPSSAQPPVAIGAFRNIVHHANVHLAPDAI